jgi:hypothetical protein
MNVFLLDLWHDLKEKRLWPIAAALLLGLVAVPVLLAKPAGTPSAPAPVAGAASAPKPEDLRALARVKLGDDEPGDGSTLGVFDPDDPFKPPKGAVKSEKDAAAGPSSAGPASGSSPDTSGGGGADTSVTTGGTTGDTTGGTTQPGGTTGGTVNTTTTVYKYVVDITFSANGRTRRIKGMEKLDMLPSESSPLLIFMGVTENGGNAVFLVDSTLEAAGEGRCKPSESECAFAYIGPGNEYSFTEEDGDTYTIKIDEIRKVRVGASASAKGAKGAKARASVGPTRRFVPPILADLVVVAKDRLENSNDQTESR